MKLVVFGGFIFLSGAILLASYCISTTMNKYPGVGLGSLFMVFGFILGFIGLVIPKKD